MLAHIKILIYWLWNHFPQVEPSLLKKLANMTIYIDILCHHWQHKYVYIDAEYHIDATWYFHHWRIHQSQYPVQPLSHKIWLADNTCNTYVTYMSISSSSLFSAPKLTFHYDRDIAREEAITHVTQQVERPYYQITIAFTAQVQSWLKADETSRFDLSILLGNHSCCCGNCYKPKVKLLAQLLPWLLPQL